MTNITETPTIIFKNKGTEINIKDNFKFDVSDVYYMPHNFNAFKIISFGWSVEYPQSAIFWDGKIPKFIEPSFSQDEIFEILGDKLKNDFINYAKNQCILNKRKGI